MGVKSRFEKLPTAGLILRVTEIKKLKSYDRATINELEIIFAVLCCRKGTDDIMSVVDGMIFGAKNGEHQQVKEHNKIKLCVECKSSEKMFNGWADILSCRFNDVDPVTGETSVFRTYPECKNVNIFGECPKWEEK